MPSKCCIVCIGYESVFGVICKNVSCRCHWYEDELYGGEDLQKRMNMKNLTFEACLLEMGRIHEQKNADYANEVNPYSNFEYAAKVAEPFTGVDKVFATLLGVKLARLAELKKEGRIPQNESLFDSHLDESTYSTIWWAYAIREHEERLKNKDKF